MPQKNIFDKAADYMGKAVGLYPDNPDDNKGVLADKQRNIREYKKAVNAERAPKPEEKPAPAQGDKINPKGKYGDRPGEKRIIDSLAKGTDRVSKTGLYKLHKDEAVLPAEEAEKLRQLKAAGLELSDENEDVIPEKELKEIRIRKAANGGYIVEHHYTCFEHKMEEFVAPDMETLHSHVQECMGCKDEEEGDDDKE